MFSPRKAFAKQGSLEMKSPKEEQKEKLPDIDVQKPKAVPLKKMNSKENADEKFPSGSNSPQKSSGHSPSKNDFASTLPNLDKKVSHGPILEMDLDTNNESKPAIMVEYSNKFGQISQRDDKCKDGFAASSDTIPIPKERSNSHHEKKSDKSDSKRGSKTRSDIEKSVASACDKHRQTSPVSRDKKFGITSSHDSKTFQRVCLVLCLLDCSLANS